MKNIFNFISGISALIFFLILILFHLKSIVQLEKEEIHN